MTETEARVVEAARQWLAAKEEMLAADQEHRDFLPTERALDDAEAQLTDAVYLLIGKAGAIPERN